MQTEIYPVSYVLTSPDILNEIFLKFDGHFIQKIEMLKKCNLVCQLWRKVISNNRFSFNLCSANDLVPVGSFNEKTAYKGILLCHYCSNEPLGRPIKTNYYDYLKYLHRFNKSECNNKYLSIKDYRIAREKNLDLDVIPDRPLPLLSPSSRTLFHIPPQALVCKSRNSLGLYTWKRITLWRRDLPGGTSRSKEAAVKLASEGLFLTFGFVSVGETLVKCAEAKIVNSKVFYSLFHKIIKNYDQRKIRCIENASQSTIAVAQNFASLGTNFMSDTKSAEVAKKIDKGVVVVKETFFK